MTSSFPVNLNMGIGGELTLSLDDFMQRPGASGFLPDAQKHQLLLDTGRAAIYLALLNILRRGGRKEAWLPAYCCSSVLLPFHKLGFKLHFYTMGSDLASPGDLPLDLKDLTFVFIHYFGKRNRVIQNYLMHCKGRQNFFVIEDCVQALFTQGLGNFDYAVYSLRKFLPLPDGALLAADTPLSHANLAPPDEGFVSRRLIGKLIRGQAANTDFLNLFSEAETFIDECPKPRSISFLSRYLMTRLDPSLIARQRRANFNHLVHSLKSIPLPIELLFNKLEEGEVPLGLPVRLAPDLRNPLQAHLMDQGIYCPVHWRLANASQVCHPAEQLLSNSLLTLPLDQSLAPAQLDYTAEKVRQFFNTYSGSYHFKKPNIGFMTCSNEEV